MPKPRVTLDRILSRAGIASRTTTKQWISAGRVKVNGKVIRDPNHWVETGKDVVHFDGMKLRAEKKIYIALNKPTGVVTSHGDNEGRPTVYEYVKKLDRWVFPVGRLDMDTSGLLILTNDTEFGNRLLNPDSKIPKTYYVKVSGNVSPESYARLSEGLDIGGGEFSGPAVAKEVRRSEKYTWFELTITEGKNRQVRRMCKAIGHPVLKLVRIRIGSYEIGALPAGAFVKLEGADLSRLLAKGKHASKGPRGSAQCSIPNSQ
ncbi:MAG TPA: pseudouridine synthase, partial [Terriglobia bacterium]|nr:pseudouridine synthase [Terriglobia bacterium]